MKNKIMKKIGILSLAGVLGLSISGCTNKTTVDEEKLNVLMEDLQGYLDSQKKTTTEQAMDAYIKGHKNLLKLSMDHNYTYRNDNEYARVEYLENKTKVYFYTLNDNNEKTDEVYREIHDNYVYTYIKDLNIYSKIPLNAAIKHQGSLLTFDGSDDLAVYNEDGSLSKWFFYLSNPTIMPSYHLDLYKYLYSGSGLAEIDAGFEILFATVLDSYKSEEGKDIFVMCNLYKLEESLEYFEYLEQTLVITDKSLNVVEVSKCNSEGVSCDGYTDITEISFDKDSTINFNIQGYELAR